MTSKSKGDRRKRREAFETKLDGREICDLRGRAGRREYRLRTLTMWHRQDGICPMCGKPIAEEDASFDHIIPRGFNGAFRDDRIEIRVDGHVIWQNQCLHLWCNIKKGSRREVREDVLLRQTAMFTTDRR